MAAGNPAMKWTGKRLLCLLLLCFSIGASVAGELHPTDDLRALGQQARESGRMILLLVSLEDCPWCDRLKAEVLDPMIKGGDFSDRLIIAEIGMDAGFMLYDFDGTLIDGSVWAGKRNIYTSPTLLFLDSQGQERVKRILGYNSADLFPFYLEESIQQLLSHSDRSLQAHHGN